MPPSPGLGDEETHVTELRAAVERSIFPLMTINHEMMITFVKIEVMAMVMVMVKIMMITIGTIVTELRAAVERSVSPLMMMLMINTGYYNHNDVDSRESCVMIISSRSSQCALQVPEGELC